MEAAGLAAALSKNRWRRCFSSLAATLPHVTTPFPFAPVLPSISAEAPLLKFNSSRHLINEVPRRVYPLEYFGFQFDPQICFSPMAVSAPFRLLSDEALTAVRSTIESPQIKTECQWSASIAPCVLRGVAKRSPFIRDLIDSPDLTRLVSSIAGIQLRPHPMDLERAHFNVQKQSSSLSLAQQRQKQSLGVDGGMEAEEEDEPVFCWHKDSQPFVLVCMISDVPAGARGGETAVKHADSTVLRLTFPAAGYAYLLQGSAIDHAALPARNFQRVTMITSYVPAETSMAEWTDLRLASLYSDRRELGDEFLLYRARRLQERLDRALSVHGCGDVEGALREMRKLREEVLHVERNLSYLQ